MKVTRRPTRFEVGWARRPDGDRDLVVVMIVGEKSYVGTPTTDEARALRRHLGQLLNNERRAAPTSPAPRRRLLRRR